MHSHERVTGAPVFQPQSPASRNEATREIKSLVFGHSPRPAKSHASRVSVTFLPRDASSAKRGIAIVSHPSVRLSVCPSVRP